MRKGRVRFLAEAQGEMLYRFLCRMRTRMGRTEPLKEKYLLLHPGRDGALQWERQQIHQLATLLAGVEAVLLITCIAAVAERSMSEISALIRPEYGALTQNQTLLVEGLPGDVSAIELELEPRLHTREEAGQLIEAAYTECLTIMLGDNKQLSEVTQKLNFPSEYEGIQLSWQPQDMDVITGTGMLIPDHLTTSSMETEVRLVMKLDGYERTYRIPIFIVKQSMSVQEQLQTELWELSADREQQTISLPAEFQGYTLHFFTEKERRWPLLLILGIAICLLLWQRQTGQIQEQWKLRQKSLKLGYADFVSRLSILVRAGLPVRQAWLKLAGEYEHTDSLQKKDACGIEVIRAARELENGMPELEMYRRFAARCGNEAYRHLSNLLSEALLHGNGSLSVQLANEAGQALEQRKNAARKQGEEAAAKLVFPLMLLFAAVMLEVIYPAFSSFDF